MKTRADFLEGDNYGALKEAMRYLGECGYSTKVFADINGDATLSVVVDDDGEEAKYICTWKRV